MEKILLMTIGGAREKFWGSDTTKVSAVSEVRNSLAEHTRRSGLQCGGVVYNCGDSA